MGKYKDALLALIIVAIFLAAHMIVYALDKRDEEKIALPEPAPVTAVEVSEPMLVAPAEPEPQPEAEQEQEPKPEPETPAIVYYNVPLDHETQDLLRQACEENDVDMVLALAMIRRETQFKNITGDGGASHGYMQVQTKWHSDRMERLGVTDLYDPLSNFRVGCNFIAELLEKYPLTDALTWYNSGETGRNQYADDVIAYMEEITAKGGV